MLTCEGVEHNKMWRALYLLSPGVLLLGLIEAVCLHMRDVTPCFRFRKDAVMSLHSLAWLGLFLPLHGLYPGNSEATCRAHACMTAPVS